MSLTLALLLTVAVPDEDALLRGIRCVETSCDADKRDGDRHRPICERSVYPYHVTPRAVRHLVALGRLDANSIPGYSLTNCTGIRAYLRTERGGREAARAYLRFMFELSEGDEQRALQFYNCGAWRKGGPSASCVRYAGQVLLIAGGSE